MVRYLEQELPRINAYIDGQIEKLDPLVRPVAAHVMAAGGKRFRPILTILTARALGCAGRDIYPLACSLEFLHSATLLHDDILDSAELRRGKAAAHVVYSKAQTILTGDLLLALANKLVADYDIPALVSRLSEAVMRTCVGEIREIAVTRNPALTVDEYMEIITGKTAYLIQAASECGALLSDADERQVRAAAAFGLNQGIAFQLVDDAIDYESSEDTAGKPVGKDLREGKVTLPLLRYLDTLSPDQRHDISEKFAAGKLTEKEIHAIITNIQELDLASETRQRAAEFIEKARQALEVFPQSPEKSILKLSLPYVLARKK
jgi:octaprenyl-diphosphate synthase